MFGIARYLICKADQTEMNSAIPHVRNDWNALGNEVAGPILSLDKQLCESTKSIQGTFLGIVLSVTCITRQTGLVTCRPSTARELPTCCCANAMPRSCNGYSDWRQRRSSGCAARFHTA